MKIIVGNTIQATGVHTLRRGTVTSIGTKFLTITFENATNGQVKISMTEMVKEIKTGSCVSDEAMYEHEVQAIQFIISDDEQAIDATQSYSSVGTTKI